MRDDVTFETRLADALGRYAELAPAMDDLDVAARAIAAGRPTGARSVGLPGCVAGSRSRFATSTGRAAGVLMVVLALLLAASCSSRRRRASSAPTSRGHWPGTGRSSSPSRETTTRRPCTHLMNADGTGDRPIDAGRCPMYSARRDDAGNAVLRGVRVPDRHGRQRERHATRCCSSKSPASQVGYALSPDGTQVAWVKPVDPTRVRRSIRPSRRLRRVRTSSSGWPRCRPAPVIRSCLRRTSSPRPSTRRSWSPDGGSIAFGTLPLRRGDRHRRRLSIDVVDVDGSDPRLRHDAAGAPRRHGVVVARRPGPRVRRRP